MKLFPPKTFIHTPLLLCSLVSGKVFAGWEVQWIDSFNGTGVNWDNWTAHIQANFNNEIQCYTNDDSSANRNYEVSNGTLKIIARRETVNCQGLGGQQRSWTSGRLVSKDKQEFLYGRIEARIRFHDLEGGTWPAFWMLENRIVEDPIRGDNDTVNWPNPGAGEIDVWEWFANDGGSYITNFFNTEGCGHEVRANYPGGASDVTSFHDYAIEWSEDTIQFFMNDSIVATHNVSNCLQYKEPMYALLNVAIGGNLGGTVDPLLDYATMEVDYIAHCVASDANNLNSCDENTPLASDDDNDGVANLIDQCPGTPIDTEVDHNGCELSNQPDEPNVPAPVPSAAADQVISLFSDSYTNISGINYNPNWGQSTSVSEVLISGNNTLRYAALNYQGTDYDANHQDVSTMQSMHVDFWTSNATELRIYLISPGPVERAYILPIEYNTWVSTAIPLSAFEGVDLSDTFQLKVVGNGIVYFDNIYFSSGTTAPEQDTDGDGVLDSSDQCSNTPPNTDVDINGCPTIIDPNIAPTVNIRVMQAGVSTASVDANQGEVRITAHITDQNQQDIHTIVWSVDQIPGAQITEDSVVFNPPELDTNSDVQVSVTVTDNGSPSLSSEASINFTILAMSTDTGDSANSDPTPSPTSAPEDTSGGGSVGNIFLLLLSFLLVIRNKYGRTHRGNNESI